MSSQERAASADRHPKHQHSFSESGRLSVPMYVCPSHLSASCPLCKSAAMLSLIRRSPTKNKSHKQVQTTDPAASDRWDSSDPERCPPPLPLNPGTHTPGTSPVKANTSATVAAAAQALVDRARENLTSQYVTNPPPEKLQSQWSPQKGAQHKRLQSLQNNGIHDIRPLSRASTDLRSSRSATPVSERDPVSPVSPRDSTPTPTSRRPEPKESSPTKAMKRPIAQPLMLENTPPASDLGSEEGVKAIDFAAPLGDITNAATPRTLKNFESIHSQMLNLTSIANELQKEMVTLSRRSKDNAADLLHLKNSTKQRDDEIRGSLREIATGQKSSEARQTLALMDSLRSSQSRSTSAIGSARDSQPDTRAHSPQSKRALPRLLSPSSDESFAEERTSRAAMRPAEAGPSTVMLERVIREMATKEGQEHAVTTLAKLVEKSGKDSTSTLRNILDALDSIRDQSSKAMVMHSGRRRSASIESNRNDQQMTLAKAPAPQVQQPSSIVNDEMLRVLQKVKDSVLQSGGMTGEVKSLIKELRGEVLGMGRELGRKIDTSERQTRAVQAKGSQAPEPMSKDELTGIIEDNLADLRQHMEGIIQTRRRESASSSLSRTTVDSSEVYAVVKHALAERGLEATAAAAAAAPPQEQQHGLDEAAILNAVKEAYDAYKPEVEVTLNGLESDDILECLRQGLEDYRNNQPQSNRNDFSRDDVMDAVKEAMQGFQPPQQLTDAAEIKEEVMDAVRASLEEFKTTQSRSSQPEISRNDVVDAVKEGFGVIRREGAREIEISPDDLEHAIRAGLSTMDNPFGAYGEQVIQSLQEIVRGIQFEFKQYSEATGHGSDEILTTMADKFEELRGEIESYVDRAQDVTGKDEIISTLHRELDGLRASFDSLAHSRRSTGDNVSDRSELAAFIKAEFENLQEVLSLQNSSADATTQHKFDVMRSIEEGFASVKGAAATRGLDDATEDQLEALKTEFELLREAVLAGSAAHKEEIMEHIQETMHNLPHRMGAGAREFGQSEDMLSLLREDLSAMRESMQAPALYQGHAEQSSQSSEEIISAIKHSLEGIRAQMSAEQSESSSETIGVIKEELESFRDALGGSLMLSTPGVDKEAIMEAMRSGLEEIDLRSASQDAVNAVRVELEGLKSSLGNAMVPSGAGVNTEEIVAQIKSAISDLKDQLSSQVTVAGASSAGANDETIENINSSISGLRGDISRLHDKPVDMTVSYEILDTLKDGLTNIRSDIDRLKAGNDEVILAGSAQRESREDIPHLKREDLNHMEVLLTQLQMKVEAMSDNVQNPEVTVPNAATKDDIAGLESSLRELSTTVSDMNAGHRSVNANGVSKDDIEAIETLLQNTKAKLEEQVIPGLATTVSLEQIENIENIAKMTNEAVESLGNKMHAAQGEQDVAALALLISEATTAINDVKDRISLSDLSDVATKTNLEAVEDLCTNIKAKIEDMPSDAPTKTDIEGLNVLLTEVRESQESLRTRYEGDIDVTAQAFDDRKQEAVHISEQIEGLRGFIEETRDHLKSRMKRGNEDVRALDDILQTIEEKIEDVPNHLPDLEEMRSAFQSEFEKAHSAMDDLKLGHDSNSSIIVEKFDEHRVAILAGIVEKLDQRFNEIMASHDDQKRVLGDTATAINDKAVQHDELLSSHRSLAEDLKISIDTFGATVSGIGPALEEATSKIAGDSQTVFGKVEEMYTKIDDASVDSKTNHELTRDEIARTLAAIEGLRQHADASHPELMTAVRSLSSIVEQSFEHSKSSQERFDKSSNDMKAHFDEGFKRLPVPQIGDPPPSSHGVSFDDTRIHGKLDELLSRGVATQYDDSHVRGKLDDLLGGRDKAAAMSPEHLERLDQVHQQVMATAAEVSAFMAFQTKSITADAENKSTEADQAALELSRCLSEKELVETDLSSAKEEKQTLAAEVAKLKAEKEDLITRKSHLSADVSSLETALKIRREELHMMDQRADALERRIIEGVMDHSRALLLAKTPRNPPSMNLKRVTSNRSTATASTATPSSVLNAGVDMAIKARADRKKRTPVNPSARRIASLNQINSNVPAGGRNLVSNAPRTGLMDLKRSQSTRNPALRKASWHPQEHGSLGGLDKENEAVSDDDENMAASAEDQHDDVTQQLTKANLARSASYGGRSQTSSLVYPIGSDTDRRTSYGSTLRSALGPRSSLAASINEESEEDDNDEDASSVRHMPESGHEDEEVPEEDESEDAEQSAVGGEDENEAQEAEVEDEERDQVTPLKITSAKVGDGAAAEDDWTPRGLVLQKDNGYHTDSGLGSDLPTGAMSVEGGDYFK